MSYLLQIAVLCVLGISIMFLELRRQSIDFLFIFSGFYTVGYIISPLSILIGGGDYVQSNVASAYAVYGAGSLKGIFAIVAFYILVRISYTRVRFDLGRKNIFQIGSDFAYRFSIICLAVTIISTLIYSFQHGGLIRAISLAEQIRAGEIEGGSLVFFKNFLPFAYISFLMMFSIVLEEITNDSNISSKSILMLCLSGIILFWVILLLAGRIRIISAVAIIYLSIKNHTGKHHIKYFIPLLTITVFVGLFGNALYQYLLTENIRTIISFKDNLLVGIYSTIISEFSHMYISLSVAIQYEGTSRIMIDWVLGLLHLTPQRLVPIQVPGTISHVNTFLTRGEYTSEIIPGIVAFSWYSGSWFGPMIGGISYGLLGRICEDTLDKVQQSPLKHIIYYSVAMIWGFTFIRSGDPRILFKQNFTWFVTYFIVAVYLLYNQKEESRVQHQ